MKQKILFIAKEQKISDVGVCTAEKYREKEKGLDEKASFCAGGKCPEWAKSIVVCAFSYFSGAEKGNISRYAQGADYHLVAKEKMQKIADFLKEQGFLAECFADTGALNERLLAQLAGIAFIGKNRMAINHRLGSWFFIGYILTDCELEPDRENTGACTGCGRCISACPLGALDGEAFCEEKCLSYITQKKGQISEKEADAMRKAKTMWGCDICQEVCPHNRDLPVCEIEEFRENLTINLFVDENISNKEFRRKHNNKAFAWRGKSVLVRNQKILYSNEENRK